MRIKKYFHFSIFFVLIIFFGLLAKPVKAQYSATDLLGQFDNGSITFNDGGANSRKRGNPYGFYSRTYVVVDYTRHRMFVSDEGNNRILVWDLDNSNTIEYNTPADYVIGKNSFYETPVDTRTQSTMLNPTFMALDETNGRLFVSDSFNGRVLVFDVSGAITNGMNATNVLGQGNFTTRLLNVNQNILGSPNGLAYDSADGYLYVADTSKNRVMVFDVDTIFDGEAAIRVLGQSTFTATGNGTTSTNLNAPFSLDIDQTNKMLYVADTYANRVMIFDVSAIVNGEAAVHVLGQSIFITGVPGLGIGRFYYPNDVYVDETNQLLYLADNNNNRVLVFDVATITDGEFAINVLGNDIFTTKINFDSYGVGNLGEIQRPNSVTFIGNDLLAVGEYYRISVFDVASIIDGEDPVSVIGQTDIDGKVHKELYKRSSGVPSNKTFEYPSGMVLDEDHNRIFVGDYKNRRVLVFNLDPTTKELLDRQADYVLGADQLDNPGNDLIDAKHMTPLDLEFDNDDQLLFVADYYGNRILVFDVSTITNYEDATYVIGQADFTSNAYATNDSTMDELYMMAYDDEDNWLFAGDAYNYRVLIFDLSSGITNGMSASKVLGQSDFTSNTDTSPTQSKFADVEADIEYQSSSRKLFVTDTYNSRILVYELPANIADITNGMDASNVIGQADFTSSGSNNTQSGLDYPLGMALGDDQDLYVFDCPHRVVVYDLNSLSNGMNASSVLGQSNFTDITTGTSQTNLDCSFAGNVEMDNLNKKLYVSDDNNNRVLIYDLPKINSTSSTLPSGTFNQTYSYTIPNLNTGGTITYSVYSGTLPSGLTIDSSTGKISGTPTGSSDTTYNFVIKITDNQGGIGSFFDFYNFSLLTQQSSSDNDSSDDSSSSDNSSSSDSSSSNTNSTTDSSSNSTSSNTSELIAQVLREEGLIDEDDVINMDDLTNEIMDSVDEDNSKTQSQVAQKKIAEELGTIVTKVGQVLSASIEVATEFVKKDLAPVSTAVASVAVPSIALWAVASQLSTATASVSGSNLLMSGSIASSAGSGFASKFSLDSIINSLRILGLLPSKNPFGLVYDSVSKRPVPFALITFKGKDLNRNPISETIVSNVNGVFPSITLPAGKYSVEVSKESYHFPTRKQRPKYLRLREFYKSEKIDIDSNQEKQILLIPVDNMSKEKVNNNWRDMLRLFDLNLAMKNIPGLMLILTIILTFLSPSFINIFILVLYLTLFIGKYLKNNLATRVFGHVLNTAGERLENVIIRLANPDGSAVSIVTSDAKGKYNILAKKGNYQLQSYKLGYIEDSDKMKLNTIDLGTGSQEINIVMKEMDLDNFSI